LKLLNCFKNRQLQQFQITPSFSNVNKGRKKISKYRVKNKWHFTASRAIIDLSIKKITSLAVKPQPPTLHYRQTRYQLNYCREYKGTSMRLMKQQWRKWKIKLCIIKKYWGVECRHLTFWPGYRRKTRAESEGFNWPGSLVSVFTIESYKIQIWFSKQ
jgi:hypothetical protein